MGVLLISAVLVAHKSSLHRLLAYLIPSYRQCLYMPLFAITMGSRCKFHRFGSHIACGGRLRGFGFEGL
jgi:hypothetical protein